MYATVTLNGPTYRRIDGTLARGYVSIQPTVAKVVDVDGNTVLAGGITVPLVAGTFTVELPATDDPNLVPVFGYRLTEHLTHTGAAPSTTFSLPAIPDTVDLLDVAPFDSGATLPDPPTPGVLTASDITDTGFTLTVTGAADDVELAAAPYAFSTDNGATWSAYQVSNVYEVTGKASSTTYQCKQRVKNAAGRAATGAAVPVETDFTPVPRSFFSRGIDFGYGDAAGSRGPQPLTMRSSLVSPADAVDIRLILGPNGWGQEVAIKAAVRVNGGATVAAEVADNPVLPLDGPTNWVITDILDGVELAAGDTLDIGLVQNPVGAERIVNKGSRNDGGWGYGAGDATTGAWPVVANSTIQPPLAVIGMTDPAIVSTIVFGDSITDGTGDDALGAFGAACGPIARGLADDIPWTNMSKFGWSAQKWLEEYVPYLGPNRELLRYFTDALLTTGSNDIFALFQSLATVKAKVEEWADVLHGGPTAGAVHHPRVWAVTVTPRTGADPAQETIRVAYNDWLRAGAPIGSDVMGDPGHPLKGYIETADTVETARNSGIWKPGYEGDGTHPAVVGHAALGTAYAAWAAALPPYEA